MIKFKPRRVNFADGRTPVMSNEEIDAFAEAVLADYRPELLKEPGKLDTAHLLEYYMGAEIQFLDIYNEDPDKPIRALTTLTDGDIKVFDPDNNCVSYVNLPARTVVIDNEVTEPGNEGIELFTQGHEAGHIILHWNVFLDRYGNPYEKVHDNYAAVICCQRSAIQNNSFSVKKTLADWLEHQADYFTAAILMPNRTFRPLVIRFLRDNGIYNGSIILGRSSELDILGDYLLPQYIQEIYGVSITAAKIKLHKCGFVYSVNDIKL